VPTLKNDEPLAWYRDEIRASQRASEDRRDAAFRRRRRRLRGRATSAVLTASLVLVAAASAAVPSATTQSSTTQTTTRVVQQALGIAADEQVVVFVGRIQPLKAPDILLQAAARLTDRFPRLRVLVAGGPSGSGLAAPDGLVRLAADLGITARVMFLPPQSREELAQVYWAADLVAVPSYSESFGLVAVEAQACGTPVVAAAVGGLPVAVKDGVSGLLVDGHDVGDWADTIGALLDKGPEAMSRGALAHAANFSWGRTVDGLLGSYGRAMAGYLARNSAARALRSRRTGRRWAIRRGISA